MSTIHDVVTSNSSRGCILSPSFVCNRCPAAFVALIGGAFGAGGITAAVAPPPTQPPTPTPAPVTGKIDARDGTMRFVRPMAFLIFLERSLGPRSHQACPSPLLCRLSSSLLQKLRPLPGKPVLLLQRPPGHRRKLQRRTPAARAARASTASAAAKGTPGQHAARAGPAGLIHSTSTSASTPLPLGRRRAPQFTSSAAGVGGAERRAATAAPALR